VDTNVRRSRLEERVLLRQSLLRFLSAQQPELLAALDTESMFGIDDDDEDESDEDDGSDEDESSDVRMEAEEKEEKEEERKEGEENKVENEEADEEPKPPGKLHP
jgi:hypothetical protein